MGDADWRTLLIILAVLVSVFLAPYELMLVIHRIWKQRQQRRIARGEDVTPKKLPWDID